MGSRASRTDEEETRAYSSIHGAGQEKEERWGQG